MFNKTFFIFTSGRAKLKNKKAYNEAFARDYLLVTTY